MHTLQALLDDLWEGGGIETGRTLALAKDHFVGYTACAIMKGEVVIKGHGETVEKAIASLEERLKIKKWRKKQPLIPVTDK